MGEIIGFVGLGLMGKPMAKNLIRAGYRLVVHSRSRGPVDEVVGEGASQAASPAEVASQSTVVITMLPDTPDVEQVLAGENGVLKTLRPRSLIVDMSSISPEATKRLATQTAARGSLMIDAPVSGGEIGAINASLSIMVGGDAAAFERARPIFERLGKPRHIGESGAGQVCKVCNQMVLAGALAGVIESFALAKKAVVNVARVREALLGGFAASRVLEVHGERMIKQNYVPGFKSSLYAKDMRIADEMARTYGVDAPATHVAIELLDALVKSGQGDLDYSAMAKIAFERAGLKEDSNPG